MKTNSNIEIKYDNTKYDTLYDNAILTKTHYRSKISIGNNFVVHVEKHFNKLNKIMWKLLLNIDIEDVDITM